ncbi:myb/SANT-like DNA-binding domain-containing protein 3 isoform X2 [Leptidea sinapis]|uniref:myb/SANT-like DNA-binding domain-containing protein 3 isoform X2 n=1 Tax=Leptidea sinapis TaxID=189913 RepID=UPI0021C39833|nr:myb/SANT-like DNA-binding domain-containing protein 3 isoform X2 [Leptidea sinapis]
MPWSVLFCYDTNSSKKKPFTTAERELVRELVLERPIIGDKRIHAENIVLKQKAWEDIANVYNSRPYVTPRNSIQLKRCWENLKQLRKKQLSERLNNIRQIGGAVANENLERTDDFYKEDDNLVENESQNNVHDYHTGPMLNGHTNEALLKTYEDKWPEIMHVDIKEEESEADLKPPELQNHIQRPKKRLKKIANLNEARIKRTMLNIQQDLEMHKLRIRREKLQIERERNLTAFEKQMQDLQLEKMKIEIELLKGNK